MDVDVGVDVGECRWVGVGVHMCAHKLTICLAIHADTSSNAQH